MRDRSLVVCYPDHPIAERLLLQAASSFARVVLVAHDRATLRAAVALRLTLRCTQAVQVIDLHSSDQPPWFLFSKCLPEGALTVLSLSSESAWSGESSDQSLFEQCTKAVATRPDARLLLLSTLRVCGDWCGLFTEWDGDVGQAHPSAQSRIALAREGSARTQLPARQYAVVRVGELVSDPSEDPVSPFDRLQRRLLQRGDHYLTADPSARINTTELSVLTRLLRRLLLDDGLSGTFHALESRRPSTLKDVLGRGARGHQAGRVRYLPPIFLSLRWLLMFLSLGRVRVEPLPRELALALRWNADVDAFRSHKLLGSPLPAAVFTPSPAAYQWSRKSPALANLQTSPGAQP